VPGNEAELGELGLPRILKTISGLSTQNPYLASFAGAFDDPEQELNSWDSWFERWSKDQVLRLLMISLLARKEAPEMAENIRWLCADILLNMGLEEADLRGMVGYFRERYLDQDLGPIQKEVTDLQRCLIRLKTLCNLASLAPEIVKQLHERLPVISSMDSNEDLALLLLYLGKDSLIADRKNAQPDHLLGGLSDSLARGLLQLTEDQVRKLSIGITNSVASRWPEAENFGDSLLELSKLLHTQESKVVSR
jgi:hypothetical protein